MANGNATPQLTPGQFAARIRATYPGAYDDMSDADLTQKVLTRYPQYGDMVTMTPAPNAGLAPPATGVPYELQKNAPNFFQAAAMPSPVQRGEAMWNAIQQDVGPIIQSAQMAQPGAAVGTELGEAIPSAKYAKAVFSDLKSTIGQHTVDITVPGQSALDIADYAGRGGSMPKVIRDFIKRTTDPNLGPLTYAEARDFYSNATRLSAQEGMRLTDNLRRMVGQFKTDLGTAIQTTADQAGRLQDYQSAMSNYAGAQKLAQFGQAAKEAATEALIKIPLKWAPAGAATAWALKQLTGSKR
jgi:hypothetical protein